MFIITLPIYLVIGLGFACVKTGYITGDSVRAISGFTVKIGLPALIFNAVVSPNTENALNWTFMGGYLMASLLVMTIGYIAMKVQFRQTSAASWIHALGMSNSNSGFVGFPIASLVFPEQALLVLAWVMIVENSIVIPLAMTAAEISNGGRSTRREAIRKAASTFIGNPLVWALVLALSVRLTGVALPGPLSKTVSMVASVAPPIALFVVGGIVAQFSLSPFWRRTAAISLGKLVLHPLLAFVVLSFALGLDNPFLPVGVLFSAAPMLSIYPILGSRFDAEQVCATALIVSTTMSFATVSILIWILTSGAP